MVSAFNDSARGFYLPCSTDELTKINEHRAARDPDAEPLTESPGVRYLKYGKKTTNTGANSGKEGSWDNEKMVKQTIDYMDAAETLYPGRQIHFQFDWSSGHSKRSDDGLCVGNMNWGYGGKQTALRSSKLTAGCIGPFPTTVAVHTTGGGVQQVDYGLKVGDTQSFVYGVSSAAGTTPPPLPPFDNPRAPRADVCNDDGKVLTEGFEGKCKGIKQILFETGWWNPAVKMLSKMPAKCKITGNRRDNDQPLPPENTIGDRLLASRPDFVAEMSELQKVPYTSSLSSDYPSDHPFRLSFRLVVLCLLLCVLPSCAALLPARLPSSCAAALLCCPPVRTRFTQPTCCVLLSRSRDCRLFMRGGTSSR